MSQQVLKEKSWIHENTCYISEVGHDQVEIIEKSEFGKDFLTIVFYRKNICIVFSECERMFV